jgi:3-methyladenine DNA glycosylase Tag
MTRHRPASTYHDDSTWPHLQLGPSDDHCYFEQLVRAIFQAGLNWPAIESTGRRSPRPSTTSTRPRWPP